MLTNRHRIFITSLVVFVIATAGGGCGGASDIDVPVMPLSNAQLSGQVAEIDGETIHLDGVVLLLAETGAVATTAEDGQFDFGSVPVGTLSITLLELPESNALAVQSREGPAAGSGSSGHEESGDGDGHHHAGADIDDGEDCEGNGVHVHRVENQEQIRIRMKICDGEIREMQMSRTGRNEREVEVVMTPTEANEDTDMTGKVELESRDDRERFKVFVRKADPALVLEAVVISPDGDEESIGTREVCLEGGATWILDTSEGDELPFDVVGVEDLEGYDVEVRDYATDTALLTATLPELPEAVDDDAPGGGSGEMHRTRARVRMDAHEGGVEASVEVRSRTQEGEQSLSIEAHQLQVGREVLFEVESAQGSGEYVCVSQATANEGGDVQLQIRTQNGDALPNDAQDVCELVQHRIRIRDAQSGDVIASGTIATLVPDA